MKRTAWPERLTLGGAAATGLGMVLVTGGVRVAALFLPGVFFVGAGLLLFAAAGTVAVAQPIRAADSD